MFGPDSATGSSPEEAESKLRQHPDMAAFLSAIEERVAQPLGISLDNLIPNRAQEMLSKIGDGIDQLIREHRLDLEAEHFVQMCSELGLKVITPEGKQGMFAVLHKDRIFGAEHKPGFLMFAIIPAGHTATNHIHLSAGRSDVAGEVTKTLHGVLEYPGDDGELLQHTLDDPPRISPSGSSDLYRPQTQLWVGVYYQPELCEVIK